QHYFPLPSNIVLQNSKRSPKVGDISFPGLQSRAPLRQIKDGLPGRKVLAPVLQWPGFMTRPFINRKRKWAGFESFRKAMGVAFSALLVLGLPSPGVAQEGAAYDANNSKGTITQIIDIPNSSEKRVTGKASIEATVEEVW